ncbi:hypothetical protein KZZ10_05440 [Alcaligenaceae bacterium LF4-65]|uniref:Uncharacterized protein n=1 Tax=Zwartia hollandica TaxID=324606 RepID=A0A953N708_9BURK|nr:hypothetical protein [Zwartia hollandica]MBZ1350081.1 hypothetical protein [Zwartia hollandica]
MKYLKLLGATALFGLLLLVIYAVHVRYVPVNVVFYSAILDDVLATGLTLLLLAAIGWLRSFSRFEIAQMVCIWLLLGYSFAISVPTVIDRSLSFYILEKLQQRGGGIKLDAFDQVFTQEYVKEHRLMDVRLTEQQQSGTIVIRNGCVLLTEWGQTIATTSRYFRNHFLPKQRLLMGEYSDDLTDPFRNSVKRSDYQCQ